MAGFPKLLSSLNNPSLEDEKWNNEEWPAQIVATFIFEYIADSPGSFMLFMILENWLNNLKIDCKLEFNKKDFHI